jgi:hypothetical protein
MSFQLTEADVKLVQHIQDQTVETHLVLLTIAHLLILFFHLDFVEDAQLVQCQIYQEEIALITFQTVLTEKDFQMTKLNVFHVSHIPDPKTMELTVLLMHATPTKL